MGKDIARVLGCRKSADGCLEGDKYIVTWAFGHLVELAAPEEYDKKYKDWNMADLPMMPEPFKLEVIGKTAKQFGVVKRQLFRNDVKDIVIATDAGREGELVARFILMKADPCQGGQQKAHQETLDLLRHRQGHKGGILPPEGWKRVQPLKRCSHVPGRG